MFAFNTCTKRHAIRCAPCYRRNMALPDLNLLVTLDVLLAGGRNGCS